MKKRTLTLLEIILVIFLITLITGAIGYNMKGTLDKGRAFRTEQAVIQLRDLLLMCAAETQGGINAVAANPEHYLDKSGLAKNPKKLLEDGWGNKFVIKLNRTKDNFSIQSEALKKYHTKIGRAPPEDTADDE